MRRFIAFIVAQICVASAFAQEVKVYPTHWWAGMKMNKVQLMFYSTRNILADKGGVTSSSSDVKVVKLNRVENGHYLFVDVEIAKNAKPQKVQFSYGGIVLNERGKVAFEIKARRKGNGSTYAQGVTSADFIYMLMPDRFSNGDEGNDRIAGMREQSLNRDSIFLRHGGDLQGIINHLDYLEELGVTALWPTPVIENDVPIRSEHGYAATNHYVMEKRFGGEKAYHDLSNALHQRKMKLIQDIVYNHVGSHHFTALDKPMKDWFNEWPEFTKTIHREQAVFDPHGTEYDKKLMLNGWFVPMMPDLNQRNPFVANYLVQNFIWCVEEFGVDGYRIDTYKYNDLDFMNRCNKALKDEYPKLSLFGEAWVGDVLSQAYFVENNLNVPWKSNLPGAVDFQTLFQGIAPALNEGRGWSSGVMKLYSTLSEDFVYKNPMNNVLILDNHDMTRFLSQVNGDVDKLKIGIAWLLTCRGIPQMYYGTEILMKGISNPDGWVRLDFPGGWKGDKENKFTATGRTAKEQEAFEWTKKLANFRKQSSAIKTGKLLQYKPNDGLYVYFRYDNEQTIMCVMNTDTTAANVDFTKYSEAYKTFTKAKSVTNEQEFSLKSSFAIPAKQMWVLELSR
jgi:glycosidase